MASLELKQNLQFLTIQRQTLSKIGIDLNAMKGKDLWKNIWTFLLFMSVLIYLEYGLINFGVNSNIDMTTGALSMFNQGILILVKISVFVHKGDGFVKLIWEMNNLAEKANPNEYKKWLSENRRSQLIAKVYFYACWVAVGCAGIIPLTIMAFDYFKENEIKMNLPFDGKFPLDNGGLLHFSVNYILSMVYIYALLNMTVSIDTLFGWYIHNVSAHFRILRIKVENVGFKLERDVCRDFTKEVGAIVWYHNRTLQFVKDLNAIFGNILLMEVMLSCLQICFIIYTLNNGSDNSKIPFHIMALVVVAMQLTIYCCGGEKIKNESDMLCLDFYLQFPWHKMSVKEKKLMLLPLMRSQRQSALKGLVFEIDRSLLVYIVRTAFSFNTLLSAMKE